MTQKDDVVNVVTDFGTITIANKAIQSSSIKKELDDENRFYHDEVMDAIESLVLAHHCAGINVECSNYIAGLNTALEAIDNNA